MKLERDEQRSFGSCRRGAGPNALPAWLLAVIVCLVFSPALRNGWITSWDDGEAITENPDYNPPRYANLAHYWVPPPKREFFVPVTYSLWGVLSMTARSAGPDGRAVFNPLPFHAASVAAHAASAVLVFLILLHLTRARWAAWLGALVFAVHPLQAEAVAWAASLYTPLSAALSLLAVWQFLLFSDERAAGKKRRARLHYAIASFAFLLALLTKPSAVTAPLIVAAIEMGLRGRRIHDLLLPLGAWLAGSLALVWITRSALPGGTVYGQEPWQRVLVALDAIAFYLRKLVWPVGLAPDYGRSPRWVLNHPAAWIWIALPVALFIASRVLRRRLPWVGVSFAIFVIALLPTLGLVPFDFQLYSTVADRYAYLAMLAPALVIAISLGMHENAAGSARPTDAPDVGRALPAAAQWQTKGAMLVTVTAVVLLAALTVAQLRHWRNGWTLFSYALRVNPQSAAAHNGFRQLLEVDATDAPRTCTLSGQRLVEVGDGLLHQRRSGLAAAAYRLATQRGAAESGTYDKLALALTQSERLAEAAEACRQALRLRPDDTESRGRLEQLSRRLREQAAQH